MNRYRLARAAWIEDGENASPVVYAAALAHGRPLVLGGSAALIWIALAEFSGPASASEVAEVLADTYGLEVDTVLGDVSSFLEALVDHGLATR